MLTRGLLELAAMSAAAWDGTRSGSMSTSCVKSLRQLVDAREQMDAPASRSYFCFHRRSVAGILLFLILS